VARGRVGSGGVRDRQTTSFSLAHSVISIKPIPKRF
jgi:hypothetical protein